MTGNTHPHMLIEEHEALKKDNAELTLEKFFEEFLEEGFTEEEADKLAHEKLETVTSPWGEP